MIVIDLEFSSLDANNGAILSIGAVDMLDPSREFYKEYRVFDGAAVVEESIAIAGFTKEQLHDKEKPTFEEAIQEFIDWVSKSKCTIFGAQNPLLDLTYLRNGFKRAGIDWPWGFRSVDLHSYVFCKIWGEKGVQPLREDGHSDMNLDAIARYAGFEIDRGDTHNALNDAKITAECFSRIMFDKKMFDEFNK